MTKFAREQYKYFEHNQDKPVSIKNEAMICIAAIVLFSCGISQSRGILTHEVINDKFGAFVKSASWTPIDWSVKANGSIILSVLQRYEVPVEGILQGGGLYVSNIKKNCLDIKKGDEQATSGVYTIQPDSNTSKQVYCDMSTEGGGWTVFQRRLDGSQDFYNGWSDYKVGFGKAGGEYWLGNDVLHHLTEDGICTLRIDMTTVNDKVGHAKYSNFTVADENDSYRMSFQDYLGGIGDALTYHKGQLFSTKDQDNDAASGRHCSVEYSGAWWYKDCYHSSLNGKYGGTSVKNIRWNKWQGTIVSLKATEMMVKC